MRRVPVRSRYRDAIAFIAICLAFGPSAAPAAQERSPKVPTDQRPLVFRAGIELVRLSFTVRHRDGFLVTDLAPADFRVLIDGRPTPIELFDNAPQPLSVAAVLGTQGSGLQPWLKAAGHAFVDGLDLTTDAVTVGSYDEAVAIPSSLTSDPRTVQRELDDIRPGIERQVVARAVDLARAAVAADPGGRRRAVVVIGVDALQTMHDLDVGSAARRAVEDDVIVYSLRLEPKRWSGHEPHRTARDLAFATGGGFRQVVVPNPCFPQGKTSEFRLGQRVTPSDAQSSRCRPEEHPIELAELRSASARVVGELRREYLVGVHVPSEPSGREHSVRVELLRPKHMAVGLRRVLPPGTR